MLVGGEELGRVGIGSLGKEARLDGIEGLEVWNLNENPTYLRVILMAHSDLTHPVFLAVLIELGGDTPAQATADEHIEQAGQEVCLRNHRSAPISMVDLNVLLLESQASRVAAVEALGYHEQLGHAQVNDFTVWHTDADELTLEVEFLQGLDANPFPAIGTV